MTLYTKDGCFPQSLPSFDYRLADGWLLQPLDGHPDAIAACGWTEAPPTPVFDEGSQQLGWNGAWVVTTIDSGELAARLVAARADALAALAAARWARQQQFTYQGAIALSDDVTIGRITAKVVAAQVSGASPPPSTWKFAEGRFAKVTIPDLVAYGLAIGGHVQACFDREEVLAAQIATAATVAAVGAIDLEAGWPE